MKYLSPDHIAGWKTSEDWKRFRQRLTPGEDPDLWRSAFEEFFLERLNLRYLEPIQALQKTGTYQGEGFSIVAIQCTLIEFLESTVRGLTYHFLRKGEKLGLYEYKLSSGIFVDFLATRDPFARAFDRGLALDFYIGVRCAVLHEARTRNGWRIWAMDTAGRVVDREERIVFRDNFQAALLEFIECYKADLLNSPEYQAAFLRKFDSLCE